MKRSIETRRAHSRNVMWALAFAMSVFIAGGAGAATTRIDESQLLALGFKVLVPATAAQEKWVQSLAPGKIRAMQRNGKKFFLCPDASRKQIYVGGPNEYAAYQELHPESRQRTQEAANSTSAYRQKQDDTMRKATARDLSDPFLGVSWFDLGW